MEYRGIEYRIIQGIERGVWKWSVNLDKTNVKSGQAERAAIIAVWNVIDKTLTPKKPRLVNPRD